MFDLSFLFAGYKIQFAIELIIAIVITTRSLRHSDHFKVKVALCAFVTLVISVLVPIPWENAVYLSVLYLGIFLLCLFSMYICFKEPFENIFFCGIIAYTTQHMAYETYNFLITISGIGNYGEMYRSSYYMTNQFFLQFFIYLLCYLLIYGTVIFLLSYLLYDEERLDIGGFSTRLGLVFVVVLVDIVLNAILVSSLSDDTVLSFSVYLVLYIQSILCCILSLAIQFTLLQKESALHETSEIRRLWQLDRSTYERFRESDELINIKCHDIKQQIQLLRESGNSIDPAALDDMEREISVYSGGIETGNQVLDTILNEQCLQCERENIALTCIVDGKELNYLSTDSLCSIFVNALSNAVEAARKITDPEKRVIHLDVERKNDMIFIHVENYCDDADQLIFKNGLPQTTKPDKEYHGYGMRSMQMMVDKLGGGMEAYVENNLFHLNIMLPVVENERA